uniref:Uncharacterized protein n=1 Tax=Arundo donax TaxID=35708 RepID=A0A0A9GHG6_ARUDO
MADFLGWILFL